MIELPRWRSFLQPKVLPDCKKSYSPKQKDVRVVRHHWRLAARSATRAHRTILRGLVGVRRAGSSMKTLMANGKPRILYHLSSGHFGHPATVRRSSSHDTKVSRISPHVTPDPSHRYVHVQAIHEIRCVSRCSSRNPFPAPFGRECRPHITIAPQHWAAALNSWGYSCVRKSLE